VSDVLLGKAGRTALAGYGWAMMAFILAPALILVPLSLGDQASFVFPPKAWSLRWYEQLVAEPRWREAAVLSLKLAAFAAVLGVAVGTAAAIGISRIGPRWERVLNLVFVSPMIVPLMVIGVGFYALFARFGILGTFWSLGLAHAVLVLPFVVLPVAARLRTLDPVLERAAAASGAGPIRSLARVTIPLLAPAILAGAAFAFIFSFDEVVVAQFLSGPTLETLPRRMWEGISVGGLDKTITAVTSLEIALAAFAVLALEAWRRFPTRTVTTPQPDAGGFGAARPASPGAASRAGKQIVFDDLTKRYGERAAVENISLTVAPGEFVTLLGPSGSGKTTLLMLVAGFIAADSGRLLLADRDISSIPPHKRDIGVVFQNYALFPHLDVERNVAFPLEARGLPQAEIKRRVAWALDLVQMGSFRKRRINQLSGGQQQRIALARAVVFDPSALLMDEPLAALDRNLRLDMQNEIRQLQGSLGQSVIYVTHDQEEAINLSDRVAVMHAGRLQQVDTPRNLYLRPVNSFVAGFFGEANLFRGVAHGMRLRAEGGLELPLPEMREGGAVLCVRPELMQFATVAPPDRLSFAGRVAEIRHQSSIVRLEFETLLGRLTATRQSTVTALPAVGSDVALWWDPSGTHVMRDERAFGG
jgi:ABC-type Fe3+/spermidine/putrescine transport system ATPase subunit/ABC-type spermidine/putrescine transport system permease subunit II